MHGTQFQKSIYALIWGLTDPDQDAGRKGNCQPAGIFENSEANLRFLVWTTEVWATRFRPQPFRRGLKHHSHARRHWFEPLHFLPRHHAGVEVREQTRLFQNTNCHGTDIGERVVESVLVEPFARYGPALLGAITQSE
ncbi:unannotated protein [freshwater metagenome]|uniref:Unannotated protein n=1 Tax=freshwater metagenome TaxID=449393 RepID=A0A6J7HA76_9ZZZZ